VLSYLFEGLPRRLGRAPHFDIVTGTSVGAVHACYVAGSSQDPGTAERLRSIWASLSLDAVYRLGVGDLVRLPLRFLGSILPNLPTGRLAASDLPERVPGLFDTSWLRSLVMDRCTGTDPAQFRRRNRCRRWRDHDRGATGRSVVFVDSRRRARSPRTRIRTSPTSDESGRATRSPRRRSHCFPAIRIADAYHCGRRTAAQYAARPAIHLGADRVLVIGLRYQASADELGGAAAAARANVMNPTYLAGTGAERAAARPGGDRSRAASPLQRHPRARHGRLRSISSERINEPIVAQRGRPYRVVHNSASEAVAGPGRSPRSASSATMPAFAGRPHPGGIVARGALGDADLLSYLFFDHSYTQRLIDVGRADAEAAADDLCAFLER
jgi:NTE family protein